MTTDLRIDTYDDFEEIARGGFSQVYRCRQRPFGRVVAVKVLTNLVDAPGLESFEQECRAVGALSSHRNVITVFDAGVTANGHPYLAMQYASDGSLAERLAREGRLSEAYVLDVGEKVASALAAAHLARVLHRDLKPANILLDDAGEPLLADFGVASLGGTSAIEGDTITATVAHAAPEVLAGGDPTARSDIYSLGSTLFTLLDGQPPFARSDDETRDAFIERVRNAPLPDLREIGVSDATASVLERAMARDPQARYASADALRAALRRVQWANDARRGTDTTTDTAEGAGEAKLSPIERAADAWGLTTPERRRHRRGRTAIAAALVLVLLLAAVGGGVAFALTRSGHAPLRFSYVSLTASSSDAAAAPVTDDCGTAHPFSAPRAVDANPQTAWAVSGTGAGATLTIALPQRMRVTHVDVIPGDARVDSCTGVDAWYQSRRVESARIEFSAGAPVAHSFDATTARFQRVDVASVDTTFVRIRVLSSVAPGGPQVIGDPTSPVWDATDLHQIVPVSEVRVWAAPVGG
jgi:hypothetical protein